jgi:hypothetical protein
LARVDTTCSGAPRSSARCPQEGSDCVVPWYSSGWGHLEQGVVGEQRDDLVDVTALDGVGEAPDQLALAGGVRPWRALAVGGRQARSESRAGALQGALNRSLARVEHLGDLGGAEAEHVAEHQRRALAGRPVLEGDDERKQSPTSAPAASPTDQVGDPRPGAEGARRGRCVQDLDSPS